MTTLDELLEKQLKDPIFKEKYDALEPEFMVMRAMIETRTPPQDMEGKTYNLSNIL